MGDLEEIEQLYYKAMKDARLNEPERENPGPRGYSREDFLSWARKVDIYNLGEGAADFASEQHKEIVDAFGKYRHTVSDELSKKFTYDGVSLPGQMHDIGSCWDGSKVGTVNEMDSLYVIHEHTHVFTAIQQKRGIYRVYLEINDSRCEVEPRKMRSQFAHEYSKLVSTLHLPSCLRHGGYNAIDICTHKRDISEVVAPYIGPAEEISQSPGGYSGIRYNGPAVTSQFLTRSNTLLTWDMTPVIRMPDKDDIYQAAGKCIDSIIDENYDKMILKRGIHLIPDAVDNLWRVSTAKMEADTLRLLSTRVVPMKQTLSFCKILSSRLKKWIGKCENDSATAVEIVRELEQCLEMREMIDKMETVVRLNKKMAFAHIWIPPDARDRYNEDAKNNISINNAAVKHIILRAACKLKGAFGHKENMELVKQLIEIVFETLGNDEVYSTEHAFMEGVRISHFSVAPSMASQKMSMARDVCQQCRTLLEEAIKEPLPTSEVQKFVDELNAYAVAPRTMSRAEYSFELQINPWQHPKLDQNIHHLLAILTALSNDCGGLVYLATGPSEMELPSHETFDRFKQGILHQITETTQLLVDIDEASEHLQQNKVWATIRVRETQGTVQYPNTETPGLCKPTEFRMGLSGHIELPQCSEQESLEETRFASKEEASYSEQPVDLCSYQRLDWSENKKDWESSVKMKAKDTDFTDMTMFKPSQPMHVTPNRDALQYLFNSREQMEQTLSKVETEEPGFAIACKTWRFHLPAPDKDPDNPAGQFCDILTVTDTGKVKLWGIVDHIDIRTFSYLMETGRMILI